MQFQPTPLKSLKMTNSLSSILKTSSLPGKSATGNAIRKPAKASASSPVFPLKAQRSRQSSKLAQPAGSLSSPSTSVEHHCANCGSSAAQLKHVTRSFGKGAGLLVIEAIPMWSCPSCGASYFSAQTMHETERIKALRKSVAVKRSVPVAEFARAAA